MCICSSCWFVCESCLINSPVCGVCVRARLLCVFFFSLLLLLCVIFLRFTLCVCTPCIPPCISIVHMVCECVRFSVYFTSTWAIWPYVRVNLSMCECVYVEKWTNEPTNEWKRLCIRTEWNNKLNLYWISIYIRRREPVLWIKCFIHSSLCIISPSCCMWKNDLYLWACFYVLKVYIYFYIYM